MTAHALYNRFKKTTGYTIVELTLVVIIIGVLSTIIVVSYMGLSKRAIDTSMRSDLEGARTSIALLKAGQKNYPADASAANNGTGLRASSGNQISYASSGADYLVMVTNPATTNAMCLKTGVIANCISNWTAISTGQGVTCGVGSGKAYCWGSNWTGQLGNGSTTDSSTPVAVDTSGVLAGKTVTDISVGDAHACAIASGAVYCWGDGSRGNLGNNTLNSSSSPVAVDMSGVLAGKTITKVEVNGYQSCVIASGAAYCWGDQYGGALGNGVTTRTYQSTPVAVDTSGALAGKTVTDISIGGDYAYTGCVVASGLPYCWGVNGWGQTGYTTENITPTPVAVDTSGVLAGKTVTQIDTYEYQVCATASGQAYCWGGNGNGYLGNGTENNSNAYGPVAVDTSGVLAGKTVTSVTTGDYFSCAVANGAAYCWGDSSQGALGNGMSGSFNDQLVPVAVTASGVLAGKTITAMDAGYNHACVIANGLPYCWGDASNWWPAALGYGNSTTGSAVPVAVWLM